MEPGEHGIDWLTCTADAGCNGVRAYPDAACLAHLDEAGLEVALERLGRDGALDARGVRFQSSLLRRVLRTLPRSDEERPTFQGEANFGGATFEGEAEFGQVIFKSTAWFAWTTFKRGAGFSGTIFERQLAFGGATFKGAATFSGATFKGFAGFMAIFEREAWFGEATFEDQAGFSGTTFKRDAAFGGTTFKDHAAFEQVIFERDAGFNEATFEHEAWFSGATFQQARALGPMQASKEVVLDDVLFQQRVRVEIAAAQVACCRTRFLEGCHLRLRWARILLDDADFAAPSILSAAEPFANLNEQRFVTGWRQAPGPPRPDGKPWVASLRRADVAGLAVGNVDLQACRFAGAHNLDRLRLESRKPFASTPDWKAVESGLAWPPLWWWTRRQTLAEEHAWRVRSEHGVRQAGWHQRETWPASSSHWVANPPRPTKPAGRRGRQLGRMLRDARPTPRRLALLRRACAARVKQRREELRQRREQAGEIANLYRALRKGREDNKDEPGAADFYYGEMELRRKATPPRVERLILWVYWLVSGYGLRAWRALAATLIVLAAFAVLMVASGFPQPLNDQGTGAAAVAGPTGTIQPPDTSFLAAVVYGARTAIGLARDPQPALTRWGDVLQIAVRITVPVLLGLAVLSIRGRVRR
jgi:uncharacterized protein YjbI with pentapeptide repeats